MLELYKNLRDDLLLLDKKAKFLFVYSAIALSFNYYLRNIDWLVKTFSNTRLSGLVNYVAFSPDSNLPYLIYWVLITLTFYFVLPALVLKFVFRESLADYGLNINLEPGFFKIYAQCLVIMLPLVYWMSTTASFADKYPFLKVYNGGVYSGSVLLAWEFFYFLQFFGLEFFFRGFFIHALKPSIGAYSILAMTVPYCMIHYGKPMPESFAAIAAGIFLGWLSYKYKNIWLGLLLHCTVALGMDVLALYHKGLLF